MLTPLQLLLTAFLCFPLPHCDDYLIKTLPKVECTGDRLNTEIIYFLGQVEPDESGSVRYWDLSFSIEHNRYDLPVVYRCCISRENRPGFAPGEEGTAYCQYGNDIFVIQGAYDRKIFRKAGGEKMKIRMQPGHYWAFAKTGRVDKRIKSGEHISYLMIKFSEKRIYRKWSEYNPCR